MLLMVSGYADENVGQSHRHEKIAEKLSFGKNAAIKLYIFEPGKEKKKS